MNDLIDLLSRLAQSSPETCKCNQTEEGPDFTIGEFVFFFADGELYGSIHDVREKRIYVKGRLALAWLSDAIMVECEKRGWYFETMSWGSTRSAAMIVVGAMTYRSNISLLDAFVTAVETERER